MVDAHGSVRAVILAGGSGTRLWPRSTDARPKPFLALTGRDTLLRETYRRACALVGEENVFVSARRVHAPLLSHELPELPESRFLLEPVRRNTAPAVTVAALAVSEEDPEAILAVLPSDQAVRDETVFLAALRDAAAAARAEEAFVTIGIPPTRPETGYGYLEVAGDAGAGNARRVIRFVEKPPAEAAGAYVASGRFLWNAGVFVFRARLVLKEMERVCPEVLAAARTAFGARRAGDEHGFDRAFAASPSISLDTAVMEKAKDVLTVPCACGWSDLGSWEAVFEFRGGDDKTDVSEGPAASLGGSGNLILAGGKPARVIGLSGIAVVDSPEGLLVMRRGESEALRASVERMQAGAKGDA